MAASNVTCTLTGCNKPVFLDRRTLIQHAYCGRTHAAQHLGTIQEPHGGCHACKLPGCSDTVHFDDITGLAIGGR